MRSFSVDVCYDADATCVVFMFWEVESFARESLELRFALFCHGLRLVFLDVGFHLR